MALVYSTVGKVGSCQVYSNYSGDRCCLATFNGLYSPANTGGTPKLKIKPIPAPQNHAALLGTNTHARTHTYIHLYSCMHTNTHTHTHTHTPYKQFF